MKPEKPNSRVKSRAKITCCLSANRTPCPSGDERIHRLVSMLKEMAEITGSLQHEISDALLQCPLVSADLQKQLKTSESAVQVRLDSAVWAFVGAMPLACANRQNLFMEAIAHLGNHTGDSLIHEIIGELNRHAMVKDFEINPHGQEPMDTPNQHPSANSSIEPDDDDDDDSCEDYGSDNEDDRNQELLRDDLADDSDDFTRSDEDGWFYSDED